MHGAVIIISFIGSDEINIILVSQAFSEHSICFAIKPKWISKTVKTLESEFSLELKNHYIDKIKVENSKYVPTIKIKNM